MYNANLQLTSSKMYQILILSKLLNIYQYMELYSHIISTALSFAYVPYKDNSYTCVLLTFNLLLLVLLFSSV